MKKAGLLVSIVIPTRNSAKFLLSALMSIRGQTYRNLELIVADNQSSDQTGMIVKAFEEQSAFPVLLLSGNFQNTPHTRLAGARMANGKFIFHVDSDMELGDKVVEECVEEIGKGHGAVIIPERSFGEGFWTACKCLERSCYDNDDDVEAARFFPRDLYFDIGGHNKNVLFAEDKDLDLRVRKAGYSVGRVRSLIMHNEGEVKLLSLLRKKYGYARTAVDFLKKHPGNLVKQSILFRPAYFRNWSSLAKKPHLATGMFFMKACEFGAMGLSAVINFKFNSKK